MDALFERGLTKPICGSDAGDFEHLAQRSRKRHGVRVHQQGIAAVAFRNRETDVHAADKADVASIRMHDDAVVPGCEFAQQFLDRGVVRRVVDQPDPRVARAQFIEVVEQRLDARLNEFWVPIDRDDDVEWTVHGLWARRRQISCGGAEEQKQAELATMVGELDVDAVYAAALQQKEHLGRAIRVHLHLRVAIVAACQ